MDRNKKIHWEIGRGLQCQENLFEVLDKNKDVSYASINVYDAISQCQWNGGRFVTKERMKYEAMEKIYDRKINISIPFTNKKIDLKDRVGNETLDKFYRKGNRIILRNEELRKHIRKNYPDYEISFSITASYSEEVLWNLKGEKFWDYYKKKQEEYDIVVVPKELLEPPLFDKIKCLDLSRIEYVVDNDCYLYCQVAGKMYRYMSLLNQVPHYGPTYDFIHRQTCLPQCILGPECFDYWYSKKRLCELIDFGLVRLKIARHEEYPTERLVEQWEGYLVDYNNPEEYPERWADFREKGKNLNLNTKRNILYDK